jgi:hypothetical protein
MAARIVSRLVLLLVALVAATALILGGLSLLNSVAPEDAPSLLERNQATMVEKATDDRQADEAAGTSPTPTVALVFAGIVLLAALSPVRRVFVYHSPYRYDWP